MINDLFSQLLFNLQLQIVSGKRFTIFKKELLNGLQEISQGVSICFLHFNKNTTFTTYQNRPESDAAHIIELYLSFNDLNRVDLKKNTIINSNKCKFKNDLPESFSKSNEFLLIPIHLVSHSNFAICIALPPVHDLKFFLSYITDFIFCFETLFKYHLYKNEKAKIDAEGIIIINSLGVITVINPQAEGMLSIKINTSLGKVLAELQPSLSSLVDKCLTSKPASVHRNITLKCDASPDIYIDIAIKKVQIFSEKFTYIVLSNVCTKSQEEIDIFTFLDNGFPSGIIKINKRWKCTYINEMAQKIWGLPRDQFVGLNWQKLKKHQVNHPTVQEFKNIMLKNRSFKREVTIQTNSFHPKTILLTFYPIIKHGTYLGFWCLFNDVTEHNNLINELKDTASHDALTGLVNRLYFIDRLTMLINQIGRHGFIALMYLDLDYFKGINDTYGHLIGDELLKIASERILKVCRKEDTIARIGGDEFALVLPFITTFEDVSRIAEKILIEITKPFYINENQLYISCSIGLTVATKEDVTAKELMLEADRALYSAKENGRGKFAWYSPEFTIELNEAQTLKLEVEKAWEDGCFWVAYQPQIDVATNKIVGFESLIRWKHPSGRHISPEVFIPIMEGSNLINKVGIWIFKTACEQLKTWQDKGLVDDAISMSVNVSAKQSSNEDFWRTALFILYDTGITPQNIVIEMTESVLMSAKEKNILLPKIKELGVQLSLDDFGTGYSSLSYLLDLPVDSIKIDKKFIFDVNRLSKSKAIVQAILKIAKSLDIKVVAEGVEDEGILDFLKKENCPTYQGYLYSKAESEDIITNMLTNICNKTL